MGACRWAGYALHVCGQQIKGARSSSLLVLDPRRCFSIWLSASVVCKGRIRKGIEEIISLLVYLKSLAEFFLSWRICQPRVPTLYWKQEFPWQPVLCSANTRLSNGLWVPPPTPTHQLLSIPGPGPLIKYISPISSLFSLSSKKHLQIPHTSSQGKL